MKRTSLFYLSSVVLWVVLITGGQAKGQSASKSALNDHLHWGACRFKRDPSRENFDAWPALCLRGKANMQWSKASEETEPYWRLDYAKGYAGLHLFRYLSLHGQAEAYKLWDVKESKLIEEKRETDRLYLQLGNVGLDRYRLSAGKMDAPFGLNDQTLMDIYYVTYKNDDFWQTPPYAARLTIDNQTDIQFDFGYATGKDSVKEGVILVNDRNAYTMRLLVDIPALEGTRFVFSGYRDNHHQKRYGAALLNNSKGATTAFEWIRIPPVTPEDPAPFQQLLRLTYFGHRIERKPRFLFEYEDELRVHWLTTMGYDIPMTDYGLLRFAISYFKARRVGDVNHWRWTGGLQVNL